MRIKLTRRLGFESLERRNLLSAIGMPKIPASTSVSLPALVGSLETWRADLAEIVAAGTSPDASSVLSMPDHQANMPQHDDGGSRADPGLLQLSLSSSPAGAAVSIIARSDGTTVSLSMVTNLAGSTDLYGSISGSSVVISDPGTTEEGTIAVGYSGVNYSQQTNVPTNLAVSSSSPLHNIDVGVFYALGENGTIVVLDTITETYLYWSTLNQSSTVDIPQAAPNDAVAAAGHNMPDASSHDVVPGTSGLATDGSAAALSTVGSQYDLAFPGNAADSALLTSGENGLLAADAGSSAAPSAAVGGNLSSEGGDNLDTLGRAEDFLPGGLKSAAQADGGVRARSDAAAARGDSAPARADAGAPDSLDSADGDMIDLADAAPSTAPVTEDAGDARAVQDARDSRPESVVELFCDMQVAVAGPAGDGANSAALPSGRPAADASTKDHPGLPQERPLHETAHRIDPRHRASAELSDGVPLVLGAALVVVTDRIQAERAKPDRDRRLRNPDQLPSGPRG